MGAAGWGMLRGNSATTTSAFGGGGGAGRTSATDLAHFLSRRVRDASDVIPPRQRGAHPPSPYETMFRDVAPSFRTRDITSRRQWRVSQLRTAAWDCGRFVRASGEVEGRPGGSLTFRISNRGTCGQGYRKDFGGDVGSASNAKQSTTYADVASGGLHDDDLAACAGPKGAAKHREVDPTTFVCRRRPTESGPAMAGQDAAAPNADGREQRPRGLFDDCWIAENGGVLQPAPCAIVAFCCVCGRSSSPCLSPLWHGGTITFVVARNPGLLGARRNVFAPSWNRIFALHQPSKLEPTDFT